MAVDDAGHDELARAVDDARVGRSVKVLSDACNLAVAQKHVGVFQRAARDGEHRRIADERLLRRLFLRARCVQWQRGYNCKKEEFGDESFHCLLRSCGSELAGCAGPLSRAGLISTGRPSMNTCATRLLR